MKKILSLLIICLIISCTQNRYHEDEITKMLGSIGMKSKIPTDTLYFLKNNMSLVNGIVYNEFGDVGLFTNGIKNGIHKEWYNDGQLKEEVNYKDGSIKLSSRGVNVEILNERT